MLESNVCNKIIGKLNPKQYSEMLNHLTRKKLNHLLAEDIVVNKKPEVEQREMFNRFNQANPRQDMGWYVKIQVLMD